MTDRELIERAARAAGKEVLGWIGDRIHTRDHADATSEIGQFDPLNDAGDALRLAVKLGLQIGIDVGVIKSSIASNGNCSVTVCEKHGSDPLAATHRAIVRAAAEIGRVMGETELTPSLLPQEGEAKAYCKKCQGHGTISTGIAEWSSTQCDKCDGTGYAQAVPVAAEKAKIERLEAALEIALSPICPADHAGESSYANGWNALKKFVNECQDERRTVAIAAMQGAKA